MYVYDCNEILKTAMKKRGEKETIRYFTELTTYLKIRRINPVLHFMDNKASSALKMAMTTVDINYKLFNPSNHRANNA